MKKRKRILSLVLAACLAFSGIVPGIGGQEAAAAEEKTTVIDVTDYGVYPDSGQDCAEGIQEAVQAAKEASETGADVTISFPEGRYDIYPDKAVERELYISNTVGADQGYKNKKIGIFLEDMDHVTVDGNDSLFMFHGKMMTFAAIDCEDVEFKNFKVDFQVPTVIDVTVERTEGNTAVLYIPECYQYQITGNNVTWLSDVSPYTGEYYWTASNLSHVQRFDTVTGLKPSIVTGIPALQNVASIEDLGNHRLKITYTSKPDTVTTGMCFEARPTVRDHAGTFFWKCKDLKLTSLDIQFLHGFGMVGQHSENITLDDVDFQTPAETGRASASYADFVQMSGCKGEINITNCTFVNPHDDPINIHGTFNKIVEISSDRKTITVQYMHNETAGFPNFFEGDEIEIMTAGNMITVEDSVRKVVKVDGPDGMGGSMGDGTGSLTRIRLTLDEAVPAGVAVNSHVVENITYTPTVNITNCVFKEITTRGILVTTRKPILIENNIFDGTRMASIYISNDAQGWYESGPVRDVTIRGNVFMRGKAQAIWIEPTNPTVSTEKTVHSNITIEDNLFFMENQKVLDAKSVKDLTFRNNTIYRQDPINGNGSLSLSVKNGTSANLKISETAELKVSGSGNTLSNRLYNFNGCKNVVIENNTYDGGLNAGSSLGNMSASDVTVKEDLMKVSADNITAANGTVSYESSNEKVVKVSASGVVTAVGAGSAEVTAFMTVGGRKFPTNAVTFTVEGKTEGNLPIGIEITAKGNAENLSVGDTLEFTAEQTWSGEAGDAEVTWKVTDAQTGAETEKAEISDDGTLTAVKSGAVVVTATTVNGLEASKLVSIWQGGKTIASDITVEYPSGSDKYRASSTVEGGLELDFTNQGLFNSQSPSNVLVKPLPADTDRENLTVIFLLTGATPNHTWADAGIYLYDDADNYVALQKKHRDGTTSAVALVREQNASGSEAEYNSWANVAINPIWLKLEKTGAKVTAYFSEDKTTWTTVGSKDNCDFLSDNFKLAIASQGTTEGTMTYSDVTVNDQKIALVEEAQKPVAANVKAIYDKSENRLTASAENADTMIVKWAVSENENGNYSVISTLEGASVTTTEAMKGKYVKAAVIPMTNDGRTGEIVWSNAVLVTDAGSETSAALKSANAALASASLTGIGEGEIFSYVKGTNFYQTTAGVDDREITYSFAAEDKNASVKVIVNDQEVQGTEGTAILHNARNLIEVLVTAEDGVTFGYYRFTISRTGDSNAALKELKVGNQTLTLTEGTYDYSCVLAKDTKNVKVSAAAESETAVVSIFKENVKAASDVQMASGNVALHERTNEVVVKVETETSAEPAYYRLKLKVPDASNANMESIGFSEKVTIKEEFSASKLNYTVNTALTTVTFHAAAEESGAQLQVIRGKKVIGEGTGNVTAVIDQIVDGEKIKVKVISPDKTEKVYTLTIAIVLLPTDDSRDIPVENLTAISDSQYLPGTSNEGPDDFILDQNEGTHWHTNWATSEAQDVAKRWIGVSLKEAAEVDGIRYLPRTGNSKNGAVTEYKVQYRESDDGEWLDIEGAAGNWSKDDQSWKLITFDAVTVKQIRVIGVHTYADSGNDAHMSTAEFRVVKAQEKSEVPTEEDEVVRLSGTDRYQTGMAVADELKEVLGVEKFETAIIATGSNFADALSGSYLAAVKDAPILLTNGKAANVAALHEYIKANVTAGGTIYVLGGEGAVSAAAADIEGYNVERLSGADRYETNLAILAEAGYEGDDLIVATGKSFADSLSASAAGKPILLAKKNAALNDAQKAVAANFKNIYVVGGAGAVAESTAAELATYGNVTRLSGASRYETSVAIANAFFADADQVVLASGKNFPDGLCGGALAAALNAPLVLTRDGSEAAAADYAAANEIASGYVLGGEGALSNETVVAVFGLESAEDIIAR